MISRVFALAVNSASCARNSGSVAALASSRCANMRFSASARWPSLYMSSSGETIKR
jgi:hypothetical protein